MTSPTPPSVHPPALGAHVTTTGVVVPEGSVVITPREMYAEIQGTREAVERLVATIDPALTELRGDVAGIGAKLDGLSGRQVKQGNRITTIEAQLKAAWALLGLVVAVIAVYVSAVH